MIDDLKFKKYANWVSKSDPDLINTVDEVALDGTLVMSDGEEYTPDSLMATHSYVPITMEFKEDVLHGEGVSPEDRAEIERKKQTFGLDLATSAHELVTGQPTTDSISSVLPFATDLNAGPAFIPNGGFIHQQNTNNLPFTGQPVVNGWDKAFAAPVDPIYTALKQMCKDGDSYILPTTQKFKLFLELFNISDVEKIEDLFKQLFKEPEIIEAVALDYSSKIIDTLGWGNPGPVDSIMLTKINELG